MGARALKPMGHVRMMAAAQPFLSGAISKTVNLPETATVEEIEDVYFQSWKLGLKATAIYRDNCKVGQPLSDGKWTAKAKKDAADAASRVSEVEEKVVEKIVYAPTRKRLPEVAPSRTTSFTVGGAEGYMTSGAHDDGLGEVFLKLGKQGSTLAGVMDAFSIAVSIGLQYGVPAGDLRLEVHQPALRAGRPHRRPGRPDGAVDHGLHLPPPGAGLPDLRHRSALGIYSAEERQRHLETGSYEPRCAPLVAATSARVAEAPPAAADKSVRRGPDAIRSRRALVVVSRHRIRPGFLGSRSFSIVRRAVTRTMSDATSSAKS
jgi:ribonucleoside-diphosphate reductase alpha chain